MQCTCKPAHIRIIDMSASPPAQVSCLTAFGMQWQPVGQRKAADAVAAAAHSSSSSSSHATSDCSSAAAACAAAPMSLDDAD